MSRESLVLVLGLVVLFVPSLGIPDTWKTYLLVGSGAVLMVLGLSLRYSRLVETRTLSDNSTGTLFDEHKAMPASTKTARKKNA